MNTPTADPRLLRGALVGVCAALAAAIAHGAGGGGAATTPLLVLLVACAAAGAGAAAVTVPTRAGQVAVLIGALTVGQFAGHFAFVLTADHPGPAVDQGHHEHMAHMHHVEQVAPMAHSDLSMSPQMLAAHLAAAVALAALIWLTEYLYLTCAHVLWWLRLLVATLDVVAPTTAPLRPKVLVVESLWRHSGLHLRAPPRRGIVLS